MTELNAAPLGAGLADPVQASQAVFRALMAAFAAPGTAQALPSTPPAPLPLPPALAAIAIALADFETPVWLDATLRADDAAADYLRFHTGAPLVAAPDTATFGLVAVPSSMPAMAAFAQGSLEYPDRSTTLVVAVDGLEAGQPVTLAGPGIRERVTIAPTPAPAALAAQLADNRSRFPRGVDLVFATPTQLMAVPRSVRVVG